MPYIWKWNAVYPKLLEACEVVEESFTARRSLIMINPGLDHPSTTHTMAMGIQIIRPGEIAWAHRHSFAALRFVIKGNQRAFTVVGGKLCPMTDYDLILTPGWSWHDHHNSAEEDVIWLDVVDVSLVFALNVPFYEPYPGNRAQPLSEAAKELCWGSGIARPTWVRPEHRQPPIRYSWLEIEPELRRQANVEGSPFDGVFIAYVNPLNGGAVLATMSCWTQMLRPGERTRKHRHTSSAVYFVVRGQGESLVGEKLLEWEKNDCFVIPNWAWHEHINRSKSDEAILFSVNDTPVLNAFGLYREEPENSAHAT